jgi:hypothetical protein
MKVIYVFLFTALLGGLSACKSDNASTAKAAPTSAQTAPAQAAPTTAEAAPAAKTTDFSICGIENVAAFKAFYTKFQADVAANNKEQVAAAISFPITAAKDKKTFLANYDKVVTVRVSEALKKQTFEEMPVNMKGCSVSGGAVWFAPAEGKAFAVIGINP